MTTALSRWRWARGLAWCGVIAIVAAGCSNTSPARTPAAAARFPDIAEPPIPAALKPSAEQRQRHTAAWQELQTGSVRNATRQFQAEIARAPGFYPAETALGYVALAERQYKEAVARFRSALSRDNRYTAAWRGLVDAELGAGNTSEAVVALDRIIALDGGREADRTRLELLKLRQVQEFVEAGQRARAARRLADADAAFTRAIEIAPNSPDLLRQLAEVELEAGDLDQAEAHARRAVTLDAGSAGAHGALAAVLVARGRPREAAAALARARAIDPACCAATAAALTRLEEAGPPELRGVSTAASVTRGQLAALIDLELETLVARGGRRTPQVATDLRGHWAATAIARVTQAGIMPVYPNHTFQPAGVVGRAELAGVAAELIGLALQGQPNQLAKLRAARPAFTDVQAAHVAYSAAALAVSAGAMTATGGRFQPARAATGAEVMTVLARVGQLASR